MKKKVFALVLVFSLVSQLLPVNASDEDKDISLEDAATAINEVSDISNITEDVIETKKEVYTETNGDLVTINKDESNIVCVESDEIEDFSIELPSDDDTLEVIDDDMVMTEGEGFSVGTEIGESEIRNSFVIEDETSPEVYEVEFNLPQGTFLRYAKDLEGFEDGSIEVADNSGDVIMAIDLPYAFDAEGKELNTYYVLKGNTVTQVVKHKGVDNVSYPIIADPSVKFGSWFKKSSGWGMNGKWRCLKLVPKLSVRATGASGVCNFSALSAIVSNSVANASWNAVYNKYHNSKYWKNTKGMKKQYYCHFYFAFVKKSFNLEPGRPNVSWTKTIKAKCNPT